MMKLSAGLFAATLVMGLGSVPTPSYAGEAATEEADGAATDSTATKDETMLEKLEDAFKETTTPTDEETDPIGTAEDADRDLY